MALSLGTSDTLFACMNAARTSSQGEGCLFASPDGTNYMALICFMNGSLAREAVRDQFGLDWAGFDELLHSSKPGNGGGMMLPFFGPEIVPKVDAPKVIRKDLDPSDVARNVRGVIEAQAMSSVISLPMDGSTDPLTLRHRWSVSKPGDPSDFCRRPFLSGSPLRNHKLRRPGAALRACFSFRRQQGERVEWQKVVDPFTRPVPGSTIRPEWT